MLEDYEEHIAPLVKRYPDQLGRPQDFAFDRFKIAASWVSSRAFGVDSWHGEDEASSPDDSESCQQWRQGAGAGEVLGTMTGSVLCVPDITPDATHLLLM